MVIPHRENDFLETGLPRLERDAPRPRHTPRRLGSHTIFTEFWRIVSFRSA
jgi:hypothetical protein